MVREDLPVAHQAVQACHAAIKAARSFLPPESNEETPSLVVCVVPDEAALKAFCADVRTRGIRCADFQEDDLGGATTAFATELISGERRRIFRKCRLLKGESLQVAA